MTDNEYLNRLRTFLWRLGKLNPMDQDDVVDYAKILKEIRLLNAEWAKGYPLHD